MGEVYTPWADNPGADTPWADTPGADTHGADTPPETATAADGTHPTGMNPCCYSFMKLLKTIMAVVIQLSYLVVNVKLNVNLIYYILFNN